MCSAALGFGVPRGLFDLGPQFGVEGARMLVEDRALGIDQHVGGIAVKPARHGRRRGDAIAPVGRAVARPELRRRCLQEAAAAGHREVRRGHGQSSGRPARRRLRPGRVRRAVRGHRQRRHAGRPSRMRRRCAAARGGTETPGREDPTRLDGRRGMPGVPRAAGVRDGFPTPHRNRQSDVGGHSPRICRTPGVETGGGASSQACYTWIGKHRSRPSPEPEWGWECV